ncbi:MAG: hypothetical protein V3V99_04895 [candidate division Zixibacteria bacterium]
MGYKIVCSNCDATKIAYNIDDLIKNHIDEDGKLIINCCDNPNTSINKKSDLQEKSEKWERWIKRVLILPSEIPSYSPYVFLVSNSEDSNTISGAHFHYFKDTRQYDKNNRRKSGALKHGHGPGGPPVLDKEQILFLLEKLIESGLLSKKDLLNVANKVN